MRHVFVLLLSLTVPSLALGQRSEGGQKFEESVTVAYVEVPVTVLGKDGAPVRGLTKANFEIRDDGEKREIASFEEIDFAAAPDPSSRVSPLNPASRRNFLLLFDLSFSSPQSVGRAQEAARDFVARSISGRDLVGIGVIDVDRGFRFITAFTTDRELLTAAIADPANFRSTDPLQIASSAILQVPPQQTAGLGERESTALENMRDIARQSNRLDESFARTRVKKQVAMLADVARVLQRLAGRKHLVLLSEGFDPRLVQGRGAGNTGEQDEEDRAVESGELWKVDSDKRFGNSDSQSAIAAMAGQFRRSDVVLHAVDILGLRVNNDARGGARFNSNEGLFLLAGSTGGTVFRNSNDISGQFEKLTRQHDVVYVLGFRAPAGKAGQFHELKVRINVPGARVQHRGGYYDPGTESLVERSLTAAEIIVNDIPQTDLAFDALAVAFPGGQHSQVPVMLDIRGSDLVRHGREQRATLDIFVYAFDDQGIVRDSIYQRVLLDTSQVGERLESSGVRFYGTLDLPPGRYALKTLLRVAESERRGFQRLELNVPARGDVAVVPPLFFADEGTWVMVKAASDDPSLPYPFMLGEDAFIPDPRATVRSGEPRLFTVFVFNSGQDEMTWDVVPEAKLVSRTTTDDVTRLVFALERVPAGTTELAVTIGKEGSGDSRRVQVPIHVQ